MSADGISTVLSCFRSYQEQIDYKNDKLERLVKLSRDVTIESKRIIFQLHRDNTNSNLETSLQKFELLKKSKWVRVSKELEGESGYQYLRAYSPGLQEYIEAMAFYHYLVHGKLISLEDISSDLTFSHTSDENSESKEEKHHTILIPIAEYLMGIADFSGELMRHCISSIGKNGFEKSDKICDFLKMLFEAFASMKYLSKDLNRKIYVLKQSLMKVESALYTVKLRGSELPEEHLLFTLNNNNFNSYAALDSGECDRFDDPLYS